MSSYDDDYELVTRSLARITHPNGVIKIDFPLRASGFWKPIYSRYFETVITLSVFLVFVIILFKAGEADKEKGKGTTEENSQAAPPVNSS